MSTVGFSSKPGVSLDATSIHSSKWRSIVQFTLARISILPPDANLQTPSGYFDSKPGTPDVESAGVEITLGRAEKYCRVRQYESRRARHNRSGAQVSIGKGDVKWLTDTELRLRKNVSMSLPKRINGDPVNTFRQPFRALLVEDSLDDARLIEFELRRARMAVGIVRVETELEFSAQLSHNLPDFILCDFHLPRFDCFRVFDLLQGNRLRIPIIVMSHFLTQCELKRVMSSGARAYVPKGEMASLPATIVSALSAK
jgi:CheY-like chemotaxis protein